MLSPLMNRSFNDCLQQAIVGSCTSAVMEVLNRCNVPGAVMAACKGKVAYVSPEKDLFLRHRFVFDYTPHLAAAALPMLWLAGYGSAEIHGKILALMGINLLGVVLTDASVLLIQHRLHVQRASSSRSPQKQRMSVLDTFVKLTGQGGHLAPSFDFGCKATQEDEVAGRDVNVVSLREELPPTPCYPAVNYCAMVCCVVPVEWIFMRLLFIVS
eukprot:TRINITY_DN50140_c0_g1_i1.p1 TRINITY_DN50140_c0_g1~~TRINITY_DN50140_c0_g1_i1.p1  ORF type:complete len:213 (-),score=28.68 TRINITY_DN50140_c0_g1_i1:177-815(-)